MNRYPKPNAFTLIELLVVISIIALLIGILLPALAAARETARGATCLSKQKQIGIAAYTYSVDENGFWPVERNQGPDAGVVYLKFAPNPSNFRGAWHKKLVSYFNYELNPHRFVLGNKTAASVYHCPSRVDNPAADLGLPSYAHSDMITWNFSGTTYTGTETARLKVIDVVSSSERAFIIDYSPEAPIGRPLHHQTQTEYTNPAWNGFRFDHSEAGNIMYFDGHASAIKEDVLKSESFYVWAPRRGNIQ